MCFEEFYCSVSYFFEQPFYIFLNEYFFLVCINIVNLSLFLLYKYFF